jgi:CRISPR type II-A-associated protein Csn2
VKLVHPELFTPLDLSAQPCWELVVESQPLLCRLVRDLVWQMRNDADTWVLSKNSKPLPLPRSAAILFDPFTLDPAKRSGLSVALLQRLQSTALNGELTDSTLLLMQNIQAWTYRVIAETQLSPDIQVDDSFAALDLLKALKPQVCVDDSSAVASVLDYCAALADLTDCRLIVAINLRIWLNDSEFTEVCNYCQQLGLCFVTISHFATTALPGVERLIVDADLCEF